MPRIAAIDYGRARIGVALSDELKMIAQPFLCLSWDKQFFLKLKAELLKKGAVEKVVIGLPLQLNGKEGEMAKEVRAFAALFEKEMGIPVIFWDERLTTAQVERSLKEGDLSRKKRSTMVDSLCATLILQSYLDAQPPIL